VSVVEKVARAICRTRCRGEAHPCDRGEGGICKTGFCIDWRLHKEGAMAAIEAMREPTFDPEAISYHDGMTRSDWWRAMVAAALTEPEGR